MTSRFLRLAALVFLLVAGLSVPAQEAPAPPAPDAVPEPFPQFEEIADHVAFWTRVYAEWSQAQVAVHDMDYPGIVYEVVDLPGPIEPRYTEAQSEFVERLVERWEKQLQSLEKESARKKPRLSDEEKTWALLLTTRGGTDAVRGAGSRVRTQRGLRERFRRGIEIGYRYDDAVRRILAEAGVPEDLAFLPHVESSYQARARSSAGAVGVWQFTRGTGKRFLTITSAVDERLDPLAAAHGAARYLAGAFEELGDWPIALTSYNHGVAGMRRAVQEHGADYRAIFGGYKGRLWGFASKNFYAEFLAAREVASNPQRYFPEGLNAQPPFEQDALRLDSRTTPARLARVFGVELEELAALNPAWTRQAVEAGHSLPQGLNVWLPLGRLAELAGDGREPDYSVSGWIDRGGAYVVQPGDTLSLIADTYGTNVARLRELNGMPAGDSLIRAGQRLRLDDGEDAAVHVVARGDTLSTIAREYRMRVSVLRHLNGLAPNESLIRVGQKLRVVGEAGGAPEFHIVRRGDNLTLIALRYGVRLVDLLLHNHLSEQSIIHPGQRILIPHR